MHKSAAALVSIVLAVAFLAACGDSGSSSSTTTKTATVPTGKLGATTGACTPPRVSGTTVHALTAVNVSCDVATEGFNSVYRTNRFAGWTCKQSISGRNVRVTCTKDADTSQQFSSSWSVS